MSWSRLVASACLLVAGGCVTEPQAVDSDALVEPCAEVAWFPDADGDGFGDPAGQIDACEAPLGFIAEGGDCDDGSDQVHPGAAEWCDGTRSDCADEDWDGDSGLVTWTDAEGTSTDRTAEFAAGTADGLARIVLDEPGSLKVCPGTWHVAVSVQDDVVIEGVGGPDRVILDGADRDRLIVIEEMEDGDPISEVRVSGLHLTRGYNEGYGGALYAVSGARLEVSDLRITQSRSDDYGGGAMFYGHEALSLDGLVVEDNAAVQGGGLFTYAVASLSVDGLTAIANRCDVDVAGWYDYDSQVSAKNVHIERNVSPGWGGGAVFQDSLVSLQGASFLNNEGDRGGGMVTWRSQVVAEEVRFEGNRGRLGAGVLTVYDEADTSLERCTFVDNEAGENGGVLELREGRMSVWSTRFEGSAPIDVRSGEPYAASALGERFVCTPQGCVSSR